MKWIRNILSCSKIKGLGRILLFAIACICSLAQAGGQQIYFYGANSRQVDQLVSNVNWLPDGTRYIDSIFYSTDHGPEYKMGEDFFNNYLIQQLRSSQIDLNQIQDEVVNFQELDLSTGRLHYSKY